MLLLLMENNNINNTKTIQRVTKDRAHENS